MTSTASTFWKGACEGAEDDRGREQREFRISDVSKHDNQPTRYVERLSEHESHTWRSDAASVDGVERRSGPLRWALNDGLQVTKCSCLLNFK